MVALEFLRENWAWGVIVLGVIHCWMVYLAHYRAPESRPPAPASEGGAGGEDQPAEPASEIHDFPGGIQETNLPVPSVLRVFYLLMAVWAVVYVFWIRFRVGSY